MKSKIVFAVGVVLSTLFFLRRAWDPAAFAAPRARRVAAVAAVAAAGALWLAGAWLARARPALALDAYGLWRRGWARVAFHLYTWRFPGVLLAGRAIRHGRHRITIHAPETYDARVMAWFYAANRDHSWGALRRAGVAPITFTMTFVSPADRTPAHTYELELTPAAAGVRFVRGGASQEPRKMVLADPVPDDFVAYASI